MSLRLKLIVIISFVALVPLTISAFTLLNLHQEASDRSIRELHHEKANHGASIARTYFENLEHGLASAVQSIQWAGLSPEERNGALWLIYRQMDDIAAVTLLDDEGEGLSAGVYAAGASADETLARHPKAPMPVLQGFARHIPFAAAEGERLAIGEAFAPDGSDSPLLPIALGVDGADGAAWVVAVCVSLRTLCGNLKRGTSGNITTYLVDPLDRLACHPNRMLSLGAADRKLLRSVPKDAQEFATFRAASGEELIAAVSSASRGWRVVAEQAAAAAFATRDRMRAQAILFIGLGILAALVVGLFLAQSIAGPVRQLLDGALQFAKGNFSHRLSMTGRDELGQLSETFNHMGVEIDKRDREIRMWNAELQQRVEERTRELKEAQEQLLQSHKIAAVTALGAGIAHEVNNPLTGVIGLTQCMMTEAEEEGREEQVELLRTVETEALRVKGIVRTLLTFSQNYAGESFSPLDVCEILDESAEVVDTDSANGKTEIIREYAEDTPKILGNRTQLQQAFLHLMNNSRIAMPNGGRLVLSTSSVDGQLVKIAFVDTGKGIEPEIIEKIFEPFFTTKDNWRGEGLGLTVAFRIIEQHHGTIKASSRAGEGTTMAITLPAAKRGAHLA